MITWIQNITQKHNKVLFGLLLIIIIIAFVFTIGNFGGGAGPSRNRADARSFYGYDLNNSNVVSALQQSTMLSMALSADRARLDRQRVQSASLNRAVMLYLARQLQIPEPDADALKAYVKTIPAFRNPLNGNFDAAAMQRFRDQMTSQPGGEDLLNRVLREDFRIDRVAELLSGPGYVQPLIATMEYQRQQTEWSLELAEFPREGFTPDIDESTEALKAFYEQRKARYEIPPHLVVKAVQFSSADQLSKVQEVPSEATLQRYLEEHMADFRAEDAEADPVLADIREAVREAWTQQQAHNLALNVASEFAMVLYEADYDKDLSYDSPRVTQLIENSGASVRTLEPFDPQNPTDQQGFSAAELSQAAIVTEADFYSDAIETEDGGVIFLYQSTIAAQEPAWEDVRESVLLDYREAEMDKFYNERAHELADLIKEAVANGQTFAEAVQAQGLNLVEVEAFKLSGQRPPQLNYFLVDALGDLDAGAITEPITYGEVATIMHVASKSVPEPVEASEDTPLTASLDTMKRRMQYFTTSGTMNDLIEMGMEAFEQPSLEE